MGIIDDLPINYEADKEPPFVMHLVDDKTDDPICGAAKKNMTSEDWSKPSIFCEDCHKLVVKVIRSGDGWVK